MRTRPIRASSAILLLAALLGSLLALVAPTAASAATAKPAFQSGAYGSYVTVGSAVVSGRTADINIACTQTTGITRTNAVASANLGAAGTLGVINTRASTAALVTGYRAGSRSVVETASLLGGAITADTIDSTAYANNLGGTLTSYGKATLTNLKVLGVSVGANPAPNTKIILPGTGYVILNAQVETKTATRVQHYSYGIRVSITQAGNPYGLAVGTELYIAKAAGVLTTPLAGLLGGNAYGSQVTVGTTLYSGPTSNVSVPCDGGYKTNTTAAVSLPGVATLGAVNTLGAGFSSASTLSARTRAEVASANLLAGKVTATVIVAATRAVRRYTGVATTEDTSSLGSLKVLGVTVAVTGQPNQLVTVPGIGTLTVHKRTQTSSRIDVVMLELRITQSGQALPIGTVIRIARSSSSVSAFTGS